VKGSFQYFSITHNNIMIINEIKIFKIDLQDSEVNSIDQVALSADFDNYLKELIQVIVTGSSGRVFRFESTSTEVRNQIGSLINGGAFGDVSATIANRLLRVEKEAQEAIAHLDTKIQKGIIVQALISTDGVQKFIICKADHHEFLNEESFELTRGLPIKKRVFKGFICDLSPDHTISGILVYDQLLSKYWWSDFLELTKVHSDEDNTENSFDAIEKKVLLKIKKDHPQDYMHLSNSSIRYFRSNDVFQLENYLNDIFESYQPFSDKLNIEKIKGQIRELPSKSGKPFDPLFNIIKSKIKKKFIRDIPLTTHIELHFKEDIPNLDNVIFAEKEPDGTKVVKIRSDQGYEFFKKRDEV
jgi:hypothetical protein